MIITTFNNNLAIEGENAIGSGVTIARSGTSPSNHTQGSLSTFNPIVELFQELSMNYEKVQKEKLQSLQEL